MQTVTASYNPVLNKAAAVANSIDFTTAAENSIHSVVHVKNTAIRTQANPMDIFLPLHSLLLSRHPGAFSRPDLLPERQASMATMATSHSKRR